MPHELRRQATGHFQRSRARIFRPPPLSSQQSPSASWAPQPYKLGYYLDADADVSAESADVANSLGSGDGIESLLGAYVSPSDPAVVYALYSPAGGGGLAILALRRAGDNWSRIGAPVTYPSELGQYVTSTSNAVGDRNYFPGFQSSWTNIVAVRRLASGSDAVLVTATRVADGHIQSRYALMVDGPDVDAFADHFSTVEEIADVEPMTIDEQGGLLARHSRLVFPSDITDQFLRLAPRDDDNDGIPGHAFCCGRIVAG